MKLAKCKAGKSILTGDGEGIQVATGAGSFVRLIRAYLLTYEEEKGS